MRLSRPCSSASRPDCLASESRITHSVAGENATRLPRRAACTPKATDILESGVGSRLVVNCPGFPTTAQFSTGVKCSVF